MMPRYGPTSLRQHEVHRRGRDPTQQRRPEHDAGHDLADHPRLAEVDEQLAQPAAQQQDRHQRPEHVQQDVGLGWRRLSSRLPLAVAATGASCSPK